MAKQDFKIGDLVTLKSGSPVMTIVAAIEGNFQCAWFVDGDVRDAVFSPPSLAAAPKAE